MRSNHAEKVLMGQRVPLLSDQQKQIAGPDVQCRMEDSLGPIPGHGHTDLLSFTSIAAVERRRFGNNHFVEHQHQVAIIGPKTAF
jgi:hypothetical protein